MRAGRAVKVVSAAVDAVLPPASGITMLIYHRVGGGSVSAGDLDTDAFDEQLEYLAAHHDVISLDTALDRLAAPAEGAAEPIRGGVGRSVVITFDDGTADFTDVAVPALVRHGLPATLYAATRFIDDGTMFPWGAPPTSWPALRDAVATGLVTIGSHTHSHWLLDRQAPADIEADLDRSIQLIGEQLGIGPAHFAYPKALPGAAMSEIAVRRRFRSAALAGSRVNRAGATDPFRLARTPVQRGDGFRWFTAKADGGLRLEGELRALMARVRYRGASS